MNRNHIFDSNGPDMRLRGPAQQLFEKYLQLGRDATGASDRVMAESYFQHAEHYFRILNAMSQAQQQQGGQPYPPQRRYQGNPDQESGEAGQQSEPGEMTMTPYAQNGHHANGNGNGHANGSEAEDAQDEPREQREREQRDN